MIKIILKCMSLFLKLFVWGIFLHVLYFLAAGTLYLFAVELSFAFMIPAIFAVLWVLLFLPSLSPDLAIFKALIQGPEIQRDFEGGNTEYEANLPSNVSSFVTHLNREQNMPDVVFELIDHGGPRYREAVRLREAVLRAPLGLTFTPDELAAEAGHLHLVGLEGDTVCATAVLVPEGKTMKMQRVAVAPELQGRGIGRALMAYCERVAREHGAEKIYVHARESAVPFYEKNWYVAEGELFDEDGIPHLRMWKVLG